MLKFFVIIAFVCFPVVAEQFHEGYVPLNVQGYISRSNSRTVDKETVKQIQYKRDEEGRLVKNLREIQTKYAKSTKTLPYNQVVLPVDAETAQHTKVKKYKKIHGISPKPVDISTKAMKKICLDMGFDEDTQRHTLELFDCVSDAIKTKLTEETLDKIKYSKIDSNIVNELKSHTFVDSSINNLVQHQALFNHRNKMSCLKSDDYYRCSKSVMAYKQCYNKVVDSIKIEHSRNKIICYIKTGIRFPNPSPQEEHVRDAYFGVCVHLIERNLKKNMVDMNVKCNKILTKNNLTYLTI